MEKENRNHPAFHVKLIERNADSPHYRQATQTETKAKQESEPVLQYTKTIN